MKIGDTIQIREGAKSWGRALLPRSAVIVGLHPADRGGHIVSIHLMIRGKWNTVLVHRDDIFGTVDQQALQEAASAASYYEAITNN